jgi:hypothetical protein
MSSSGSSRIVKARVRRVIGDLEAIEQIKDPFFSRSKDRIFGSGLGGASAGSCHSQMSPGMVAVMAAPAQPGHARARCRYDVPQAVIDGTGIPKSGEASSQTNPDLKLPFIWFSATLR